MQHLAMMAYGHGDPSDHAACHEIEEVSEEMEAWPFLTKALLSAMIAGHQQPDCAAAALVGAIKPVVEGWTAARAELRASDGHMAELKRKQESLLSEVKALKKKVIDADSLVKVKNEENKDLSRVLESREREVEAFQKTVNDLQDQLYKAEAEATAAIEARKREVEERLREAKGAEATVVHLIHDAEKKAEAHAHDMATLEEKVKESKKHITRLQEQLKISTSRIMSLEEEIAQKDADYSSLDACLIETTNRKQALEFQLALHEKDSTS